VTDFDERVMREVAGLSLSDGRPDARVEPLDARAATEVMSQAMSQDEKDCRIRELEKALAEEANRRRWAKIDDEREVKRLLGEIEELHGMLRFLRKTIDERNEEILTLRRRLRIGEEMRQDEMEAIQAIMEAE